jgi:hypothetical protein
MSSGAIWAALAARAVADPLAAAVFQTSAVIGSCGRAEGTWYNHPNLCNDHHTTVHEARMPCKDVLQAAADLDSPKSAICGSSCISDLSRVVPLVPLVPAPPSLP